MYVTWVDSPTDGLVALGTDEADGNGDGEDDANGKDVKRTTVVVTWTDTPGTTQGNRLLTMGSLFTPGTIAYQGGDGAGERAADRGVSDVHGIRTRRDVRGIGVRRGRHGHEHRLGLRRRRHR